jgi:hypothetical protein
MTTVSVDHNAIALTGTARSAFQTSGTNADMLMATANLHIVELRRLYLQITALHPNAGGDSANFSALNAILAKL